MTKTKPTYTFFDPTDYIRTPEDAAVYLADAAAEGDAAHLAAALGDVARSRSMSKVAEKTGLTRASLYKALAETGNPSLDTAMRVLTALGLTIEIKPVTAMASASRRGAKTGGAAKRSARSRVAA